MQQSWKGHVRSWRSATITQLVVLDDSSVKDALSRRIAAWPYVSMPPKCVARRRGSLKRARPQAQVRSARTAFQLAHRGSGREEAAPVNLNGAFPINHADA